MTTTADEYLLGSSDPEVERLLVQGVAMSRETEWLLGQLPPVPGGRAVDLGCGPRGVLPELAQLVEPHGLVVGVDQDPVMLDHASRRYDGHESANAEFVCADAAATQLPSETFDVVHVRLVMVNVADPAAVLAEAVRLAKPGGIVVAQEFDIAGWVCDPPHPSWARVHQMLHELWASRGFFPNIGRRLPRMFADAGLTDVRANGYAGIDSREGPYQHTLVELAERFAPQLVALGLAQEPALGRHLRNLLAHLGRSDTFVIRPMTVQAVGLRPYQ